MSITLILAATPKRQSRGRLEGGGRLVPAGTDRRIGLLPHATGSGVSARHRRGSSLDHSDSDPGTNPRFKGRTSSRLRSEYPEAWPENLTESDKEVDDGIDSGGA